MIQYSNPRIYTVIDRWPSGTRRTTATFFIETHPTRGERAVRVTIDPKTGRENAPKALTYAKQVRIVDGDDGRTYLLERSLHYRSLTVMRGDMKFQEEYITETDVRYPALLALFEIETVTQKECPMTQPLTPAEFSASLARDTAVEARWTSSGHRYVAPARVVKVNAKSLLVALTEPVYAGLYGQTQDTADRPVYPTNHVITLPRYASTGYSANNGAYPVAEDTDGSTAAGEEYPGEAADLRDFPPLSLVTDTETQASIEMLGAGVPLCAACGHDRPEHPYDAGCASCGCLAFAEVYTVDLRVKSSGFAHYAGTEDADEQDDAPVPLVLDLADACGELGAEPQISEGLAWLYTTAPSDFDLAGTVCVEDVGMLYSKDGETSSPYRKVLVPANHETAQAAAYALRSWNVHTSAEFAQLLELDWFQKRFVPRDCEMKERQSSPMSYVWLGDDSPAPSFNRDDAAWLEALEQILVPAAAEDASSAETIHDAAWSSDPVTQILILARKGAHAVALALASGQLRWRKEKKLQEVADAGSGNVPAVLRVDATGRLGKLNHEALMASCEGRSFAPGSSATRRVLRAHDYLAADDALTTKGLTYCERFMPLVAAPAS